MVPIADQIAGLEASIETLRFVERHAAGLRTLIQHLKTEGPRAPTEEERAALLAHPAVAELLRVWPDAETRILPTARLTIEPDIAPEDDT